MLHPGLFTTFQDQGRQGGRKYGVPPGGAMDSFASRSANRLVSNAPGEATLEITLQGPDLLFLDKAVVAVTGVEVEITVDDRPMPAWTALFIRAGQVLSVKRLVKGARAYLAVHGGFAAPVILGSRATYIKALLSGYKGLGRPLQSGDRLAANPSRVSHLASLAGKQWPATLPKPAYSQSVSLRVFPGPFTEYFAPDAFEVFQTTEYRLDPASDRMGFRLVGSTPLKFSLPDFELASYGAVFGTIQVPPNGQPIILMADHQVTGGYPVVGVVKEADLPMLAQLLPGDKVRFCQAENQNSQGG